MAPIRMTLEERIIDLFSIVTSSIENMFVIPYQDDIYAFAKEWTESGKKPKDLDGSLLTNENALFLVVLAGVRARTFRIFEHDEFEDGEDMASVNSMHSFDEEYSYEDFFVSLFAANQQFYGLLSRIKEQDEEHAEVIENACVITKNAYLAFRPDSRKRMMTVEDMDTITTVWLAWKAAYDLVITDAVESDEEGNDEDNDEDEEESNT
jgi:hypothetical protein